MNVSFFHDLLTALSRPLCIYEARPIELCPGVGSLCHVFYDPTAVNRRPRPVYTA